MNRQSPSIGLAVRWLAIAAVFVASVCEADAGPLDPPLPAVAELTLEQRMEALEAAIEAPTIEQRLKALEASVDSPAVPPIAAATPASFPNITISGAMQLDGVAFQQDSASREAFGKIDGGGDIRRARLGARGAVSDHVDYNMQIDLAFFGRPTFTDMWVDIKDVSPLGTIRVGQWKHPFSLEVVSSYRYTTFMERSVLFQTFTPFRHIGFGFYDHSSDEQWTWAASYLRTGQDQFGGSLSTNGGNGAAGRLTHLLWQQGQGGSEYLHLGAGYFLNAPANDRIRFRTIPGIYVGQFDLPAGEPVGTSGQAIGTVANGTPYLVDTGTLTDVDLAQTFGMESLWVHGPLSWQSEWMGTTLDQSSSGNRFLWGAYTQVGWFLTGEHRPYDRKAGAIDRVIPHHSMSRSTTGLGAWEIASRWDYVDLNDRHIRGGLMENFTLGLNWFINPYTKASFNYVGSWTESRPIRNGTIQNQNEIAAKTDAFGIRCQIDF